MSFLCIHDGHITTIKRIEQDLFTGSRLKVHKNEYPQQNILNNRSIQLKYFKPFEMFTNIQLSRG